MSQQLFTTESDVKGSKLALSIVAISVQNVPLSGISSADVANLSLSLRVFVVNANLHSGTAVDRLAANDHCTLTRKLHWIGRHVARMPIGGQLTF